MHQRYHRPWTAVYCMLLAVLFTVCAGQHPTPQQSLRIIGGVNSQPQDFPFAVHLMIKTDSTSYECGGAIISSEWVVTAAHCAVSSTTKAALEPQQISVGYGSINKSQLTYINMTQVIPHPKYNEQGMGDNDIALLRLATPIATWSHNVAPVPIGTSMVYDDQTAVVMGWGITDPKDASSLAETLQVTTISLSNDRAVCSSMYSGFQDSNNDRICSADEQHTSKAGQDTCLGDSGGPLVIFDGRWVLAGITSYGNSPSGSAICGAKDNVAYYTHVAYFLPFILAQTGLQYPAITMGDGLTNVFENSRQWHNGRLASSATTLAGKLDSWRALGIYPWSALTALVMAWMLK